MMEHGITSCRYSTACGFTREEVENLLAAAGRPDRIDEVEEWYGGYRYGDAHLYNPWDVVRYVDKGFVPKPYWAKTLDSLPVTNLLMLTREAAWADLMVLLTGGSVTAWELRWVPFQFPLFYEDEIFPIMAVAGYLSAEPNDEAWDNGYELSIPNRELFEAISDKVVERFREPGNISSCLDSMESGEAEKLAYKIGITMSVLGGGIQDSKLPYEAFIIGLVAVSRGRYDVHTGGDSQEGRSILYMIPVSGQGTNIAIAVDRRRTENRDRTMEELAGDALEKIRDMGREYGLRGETILYGIAFDGKDPTIVMERCVPEQ